MASFIIEGGRRLTGEIVPQGAKNEALQVICATLLTSEPVRIKNIPDISDVNNQIRLLEDVGVKVTRNAPGDFTFQADEVNMEYVQSDEFLARCTKLRGSVMLIGPMIARFGRAMVAKPGGDKSDAVGWIRIFSESRNWGPSLIMTSDGAYTTFMPGGCVVRICCSTKPRSRVRPISLWLQCWLWVRQRYIMLRANLISNNFVICSTVWGRTSAE